jgi:hypothetical protein
MCFIVAAFIIISHPLRHPLQMIVCVGQIYGLILYYGTSMFDHYYNKIAYSRPEPWYFWGYYFFMNFIWMVFPGRASPVLFIAVTLKQYEERGLKLTISLVLLVSSVSTVAWTFTKLDKLELRLARNRSTINSYSTPKRHHFVKAVTRKT